MNSIVHSFRVSRIALSNSHRALSFITASFFVTTSVAVKLSNKNEKTITYPSLLVKYRIRCAVKIKQMAFPSTNEYPFVNLGPSTVLKTNKGVQIVVD